MAEQLLAGRSARWLPTASFAAALAGAALVAGWAGTLKRRIRSELLRRHRALRAAAERRAQASAASAGRPRGTTGGRCGEGTPGGPPEVVREPMRIAPFRTPPPAAPPPGAPLARARLLVVDDEPMVGRAIGRLLRGQHDVEALTSPLEALARAARGERWDAVLCDLMMPELDGAAFAERLERDAPDLARRIIFMSGGAFTDATRGFLAADVRPQLEKPIDTCALQAALAAVIRGAPPAE